MWDQSIAQAGSGQFASAIMTLRLMGRQVQLTPEQWKALGNATVNYEDQLRAKVRAGDESARKEMETIGVSLDPPKR